MRTRFSYTRAHEVFSREFSRHVSACSYTTRTVRKPLPVAPSDDGSRSVRVVSSPTARECTHPCARQTSRTTAVRYSRSATECPSACRLSIERKAHVCVPYAVVRCSTRRSTLRQVGERGCESDLVPRRFLPFCTNTCTRSHADVITNNSIGPCGDVFFFCLF